MRGRGFENLMMQVNKTSPETKDLNHDLSVELCEAAANSSMQANSLRFEVKYYRKFSLKLSMRFLLPMMKSIKPFLFSKCYESKFYFSPLGKHPVPRVGD